MLNSTNDGLGAVYGERALFFLHEAASIYGAIMASRKIAPPSLVEMLQTASEFEKNVFDSIAQVLSKPTSTNLTEEDVSKLVLETSIEENDIRYFISFVAFLYSELESASADEVRPMLESFLKEKGELDSDTANSLAKSIHKLLMYRREYDAEAKRQRLTRGFLPFLLGVYSFVDLRSSFDRNSDNTLSGTINSDIAIVQFLMRTDSNRDQDRDILIQLDASGLELLQKAIDEAKEKIDILEKRKL